jgi:hypothetical protein
MSRHFVVSHKNNVNKTMQKTLTITLSLLFAALLLQSCITEENCYHGVLADGLRPTCYDAGGAEVQDTLARVAGVYEFVNGYFRQALTRRADGTYALPVNDCDNIEVVALATHLSDDFNMQAPEEGTRLSDVWASLMSTTQGHLQVASGRVWYGSWVYPSGERPKGVIALPMTNRAARVTVVVDHLKQRYGEGDYSVRVTGFSRSIAYDGTALGDILDYRPAYTVADDKLTTTAVTSLPAGAKGITVEVIRDGQVALTVSAGKDGKPITLSGGESKTIEVNALTATTTISVGSWQDASSEYVVP